MARARKNGAANWKAAMASPMTAQKYKAGIAAVTENPMAKAASAGAQALYAQNTAAAVQSGRMAAKLNAVPMQVWQNNAGTIGAAALTTGAQKGGPKVDAHFQKWNPIYDQASQAAAAIPKDGTTQTALLKVAAAISVMKQAAGKPA